MKPARLHGTKVLVGLCLAALWAGCGDPATQSTPLGASGSVTAGTGGSGAGAGGTGTGAVGGSQPGRAVPLGRERCQAPAGISASPNTIEQAVTLLNALPKPTSVACFVESLARPLAAYATSSPFSAQPALSAWSPRVFLKVEGLWMSIVIDGDASFLLEFAYRPVEAEMRSIKAELLLPLAEAVPFSAPYDHVLMDGMDGMDGGTLCGLCHYGEERVHEIDFAAAFSSIAFKPRADSRVSLTMLQRENLSCDWQANFPRCELLSAMFDGGPVEEAPFPSAMPTFF